MKKTIFILSVVMALAVTVFAQTNNDNNPKHVNYYTIPAPVTTSDVAITFDDPVAKMEYVKLKIKISNNTGDYIIFKPSECVFTVDGKEYSPSDKMLIIKPYDKDSKVLDIKKSGDNFHKESFSLKVAGLYKLPAKGTVQNAPDFLLPVSANSFEAGPFKCTVGTNVKKETDETWLRFAIVYNGSNYGIMEPSVPVVKVANKNNPQEVQEFATTQSKARPIILQRGEDDHFVVAFEVPGKFNDMQFANMTILWKNSFMESVPAALAASTVSFTVDRGLTEGKNK